MDPFYLTKEQCSTWEAKVQAKERIDPERTSKACELIQKTSKRLGFPRQTILTAQKYFHVFFSKKEPGTYPVSDIALVCLLAAAKAEEMPVSIEKIFGAGLRVLDPELGEKIRVEDAHLQTAEKYEAVVLEAISFVFSFKHAHLYLLKIAKKLQKEKEAVYLAWKMLNRIYHHRMALEYPAHLLAIGCLFCCEKTKGKRGAMPDLYGATLSEVEEVATQVARVCGEEA